MIPNPDYVAPTTQIHKNPINEKQKKILKSTYLFSVVALFIFAVFLNYQLSKIEINNDIRTEKISQNFNVVEGIYKFIRHPKVLEQWVELSNPTTPIHKSSSLYGLEKEEYFNENLFDKLSDKYISSVEDVLFMQKAMHENYRNLKERQNKLNISDDEIQSSLEANIEDANITNILLLRKSQEIIDRENKKMEKMIFFIDYKTFLMKLRHTMKYLEETPFLISMGYGEDILFLKTLLEDKSKEKQLEIIENKFPDLSQQEKLQIFNTYNKPIERIEGKNHTIKDLDLIYEQKAKVLKDFILHLNK